MPWVATLCRWLRLVEVVVTAGLLEAFCCSRWKYAVMRMRLVVAQPVTARLLQGLWRRWIMSVNTALVRLVYPGRLQGRGFGNNALVVATAFTLRSHDRVGHPSDRAVGLAVCPSRFLWRCGEILVGLRPLPRPRRAAMLRFSGRVMGRGCQAFHSGHLNQVPPHHAGNGLYRLSLPRVCLAGPDPKNRRILLAPVLTIDLFRRPISQADLRLSNAHPRSVRLRPGTWLSFPCILFEDILGLVGSRDRLFHGPPALVVAIWRHDQDVYPTVLRRNSSAGLGIELSAWGWSCWRSSGEHRMSSTIVWRWPSADVDLVFPGAEHEGLDVQRDG